MRERRHDWGNEQRRRHSDELNHEHVERVIFHDNNYDHDDIEYFDQHIEQRFQLRFNG